LGIALEQAAEQEAIEALGVGVSGVTGVEVGGIGLDKESEGGRVRSGAMRTASKGKTNNGIKQ
jgi:hypothetical protein